MAEEEGFEPPRALTPLSVFKTDPFSQAWVFLRENIVTGGPLAELEPATLGINQVLYQAELLSEIILMARPTGVEPITF